MRHNLDVMRTEASQRPGEFARFHEHTADTGNISSSLQLPDEGENDVANP